MILNFKNFKILLMKKQSIKPVQAKA